MAINGSSIQVRRGVVEGFEHSILNDSLAFNGEQSSLVVEIGFIEGIVGFNNLNGIVVLEGDTIKGQRILAHIVRDHLGESNEEVISSVVVGFQSSSSL